MWERAGAITESANRRQMGLNKLAKRKNDFNIGFKCWELVYSFGESAEKGGWATISLWHTAYTFLQNLEHRYVFHAPGTGVCACMPCARMSAVRLTLITDDIITTICFVTTNVYFFVLKLLPWDYVFACLVILYLAFKCLLCADLMQGTQDTLENRTHILCQHSQYDLPLFWLYVLQYKEKFSINTRERVQRDKDEEEMWFYREPLPRFQKSGQGLCWVHCLSKLSFSYFFLFLKPDEQMRVTPQLSQPKGFPKSSVLGEQRLGVCWVGKVTGLSRQLVEPCPCLDHRRCPKL